VSRIDELRQAVTEWRAQAVTAARFAEAAQEGATDEVSRVAAAIVLNRASVRRDCYQKVLDKLAELEPGT
jgi:hypothetical protein